MSENLNRSGMSTPMRTPVPSRHYLGTSHPYHTPHNGSQQSHSPHVVHESHSISSDRQAMIYGTNIDSGEAQANLERFIREFEELLTFEGGHRMAHKKYLEEFKALGATTDLTTFLNVSAVHIKEFDRQMYFQFIYFPAEMISHFDQTIQNMYQRMFIDPAVGASAEEMIKRRTQKEKLMVAITDLDEEVILRNLEPKQVNRLISVRGIVIRVSDIHPEMKQAVFRCTNCQNEMTVALENAKVEEPKDCGKCRAKNTMDIQHNLCIFTDKQYVKFQEMPERVPEGETPQSISLVCYDDNVDEMRPGDRVEIVGIYRAQPVRTQRSRRTVRSIFNSYIDLISSKIIKDNRFTNTIGEEKVTFNDDQRR